MKLNCFREGNKVFISLPDHVNMQETPVYFLEGVGLATVLKWWNTLDNPLDALDPSYLELIKESLQEKAHVEIKLFGLIEFTQMLTMTHKYTKNIVRWPERKYIEEQPFDVIGAEDCDWIDRIGPFIMELAREIHILDFLVMMEEEPGEVYAAYVTKSGSTTICGGMTNDSGEGGAGRKTVMSIFEFLSSALNIRFDIHTLEQDTSERVFYLLRSLEDENV